MPHRRETYYRQKYGRTPPSPHKRVSDRFYSRTHWRKLRAAVLARRPLCEDPFGTHSAIGRPVPSTVVDHVIPRSTRPDLELSEQNLQALCARCHNRKTRGEQMSIDGG